MSVHAYTCRLATLPLGETSRIEAADAVDAAIDFVSDGCFSLRELDHGVVVAVDDGERIDAYLVRHRLVATRINGPAEGAVPITLTAADRDVCVPAPEAEDCPTKQVQDVGKRWWVRDASWHPTMGAEPYESGSAEQAALRFALMYGRLVFPPRDSDCRDTYQIEALVSEAYEPPALTSGLWRKFTLAFFPGASDWEVLVDHDAQAEVPR